MKNEGDLIAIFSIIILVVFLVMAFPGKVAFLFRSEVYLAAIVLIITLVFFYLWLRIKKY